ncbi:MAG: tRNA pseudouridine(38-40) synthase TruA [Betaproteobacteria bacterium]|nr:tRNA pseudouridine(38-40) synthase TruA [Betaproteobacteria bacterium]MBI2960620.1 tRNA pseudouridine(38-40) synthase TruA [Betaproteobacteria bacterium]
MKIAIGVGYDGAGFNGWQSQPAGNTIQDHLEHALGRIAGSPTRIVGAGRTDAGVHACAQVAHFETEAKRPASAWVRGANSALPDAIALQWALEVPQAFHARYSAIARTYRYVLYNHPVRPALAAGRCGWYHARLDLDPMRRAAALLVGEHDFSAFRSSQCQAKTPVRVVRRFEIAQRGPYLMFDISANAFLHHMVRNIIGCLLYVGNGKRAPEWAAELLASRDRTLAAPTMAASGLYLTGVSYGSEWGLPGFARMMPFEMPDGGDDC